MDMPIERLSKLLDDIERNANQPLSEKRIQEYNGLHQQANERFLRIKKKKAEQSALAKKEKADYDLQIQNIAQIIRLKNGLTAKP